MPDFRIDVNEGRLRSFVIRNTQDETEALEAVDAVYRSGAEDACGKASKVTWARNGVYELFESQVTETCPNCLGEKYFGEGRVWQIECPICDATGIVVVGTQGGR